MYSDLEIMIIEDMLRNGYDPHSKEHIELYWKERLE